MELEPELARRLFDLSDVRLRIRIGRIDEQAHDRGARYRLMQHLQSDGRGHGGKECHTGNITTRLVGALDKPKLELCDLAIGRMAVVQEGKMIDTKTGMLLGVK